ncbi:hypothetical protein EV647_8251 [Kribbella sp. VKM Ac-2566]|nr:hypothetical protein EV647_8251 [Kribbella sp. VKM Ac-2566]
MTTKRFLRRWEAARAHFWTRERLAALPSKGDAHEPDADLVFHIFAALAEFIRELIMEGMHKGLAAPGRGAHGSAGTQR